MSHTTGTKVPSPHLSVSPTTPNRPLPLTTPEHQQVTSDPASQQDPKNENPGLVTSDSLAAESIQGGGQFGADSSSRGPSGQPSYSTTSNTTDTSNATTLDAAPNAAARGDTGAEEQYTGPVGGSGSGSVEGGAAGLASTTLPNPAQPKGKNLQEGGFDGTAPNASFTTDIGGRKDPGRVALNRVQEADVPSAGGAGPRQTSLTKDGQFDALGDTDA